MSKKVELKLNKLKDIKKAMESKYLTRVGIMGDKATETHEYSDNETNASIGAKHEFGSYSDNIPQRSFLYEPLKEKFEKEVMKEAKKFTDCLVSNNIKKFFVNLGLKAEQIVSDAFSTGGFGKWAPISSKTLAKRHKNTTDAKPLTDTGQLARSISSEVIIDNKRQR